MTMSTTPKTASSGVYHIGLQYIGHASTTPLSVGLAASLASGVAAGTKK
jgi:hypothetical protein